MLHSNGETIISRQQSCNKLILGPQLLTRSNISDAPSNMSNTNLNEAHLYAAIT